MPFTTDMLAGEGFAGFPLPQETPAARFSYPVEARQFDGKTKGFTLDASGAWTKGHPIDQGTALSLCIRKGSIISAPDVGNTLHLVQTGTPRSYSDFVDRVRNSYPLSAYLEAGYVTLRQLVYQERRFGGFDAVVHYVNNVNAGQTKKQEVRF